MGSSQILLMVFIITIFTLLSLQSSHTFTAGGSLEVQKLYIDEEKGVASEKRHVEKVSGIDEKEKRETMILEKFRALLGLRSSKTRSPLSKFVSSSPLPSPFSQPEPPAPAPAPSPSTSPSPPTPHVHQRSHPPLHHPNTMPQSLHKIPKKQKKEDGNRRILVAVLVSSGTALLVCFLGLIWVLRGKLKKQKKLPFKTMSIHRKKGRARGKSKCIDGSQRSSSNVSLNPAIDSVYLDALGRDLEQQNVCLKQTSQTVNAMHEREVSNNGVLSNAESGNTSNSSSTREITSVHEEDVESVHNHGSVGGNSNSNGDKILPIECHDSDDESFHSFVDSHSSNPRHSNASAASFTEAFELPPSEISQPADLKVESSPTQLQKQEVLCSADSINKNCASLPPPPPPPPLPILPPITRFLPSKTSSKPSKALSKASDSSKPSHLPSPRSNFVTSPKKSPRLSGAQPSSSAVTPPFPPPPPPPLLKGNSSSSSIKGTPPPPPSQFPQYNQVGKDGAPLPKLKPLHWDKVRAAPDRIMVWDKIRSSSFELDEEMIESLFGYNLQCRNKNEEVKSKSPSPSKHVLDPKRLQNITILSKALNSTPEQVCEALMRGDGLSQQQLEALAKMVPTKEEEAKLCGYKGNINELGSAEKFLNVVLRIPFAFLRVEAMLYRETFEDEVVHLRNSFSMLEEACKELRSSRLFLKLLEAVLKTGNRMNVGTIRGGAKAFKLDALLKLADVKGTDGKTTLLHFVVQEIIRSEGVRVSDSIMGKIHQKNNNNNKYNRTPEDKEEDYKRMGLDLVSGLSTELYNVKKTASVDLELLTSSVSNLSDGIVRLKELVNELLSDEERSGKFAGVMKGFVGFAERALKELREDEHRVYVRVREVTQYFHGDNVSKVDHEANPLRIFVIVRDFLGMLDHVCKELRSLKGPSSSSASLLAPFR